MAAKHDIPVSGTTEEALALLERVDPERHAEIKDFRPRAWLGAVVSELRRSRKISQTKLGASVGATQATMSRLESGEIDPSFSRACEILARLGHRFVVAPATDEPIIVTTHAEMQRFVHEAIEQILPSLEKQAMSTALVRLADAGVARSAAQLDVPSDRVLAST